MKSTFKVWCIWAITWPISASVLLMIYPYLLSPGKFTWERYRAVADPELIRVLKEGDTFSPVMDDRTMIRSLDAHDETFAHPFYGWLINIDMAKLYPSEFGPLTRFGTWWSWLWNFADPVVATKVWLIAGCQITAFVLLVGPVRLWFQGEHWTETSGEHPAGYVSFGLAFIGCAFGYRALTAILELATVAGGLWAEDSGNSVLLRLFGGLLAFAGQLVHLLLSLFIGFMSFCFSLFALPVHWALTFLLV